MVSNKVLLIRNVMPECYGGGESYQLVLAKELIKNGYEPIIITSSTKLIEEAKKKKIEVIKAPFCRKQNWSGLSNFLLPAYLIWQKRLYSWYRQQFEKYQPVAVNIQSKDDWIAATKAGKKLGIKVLWTDHIDFRTWVLQNVEQPLKNYAGKQIIKLSTIPAAIIMISDFEKKFFEKYAKTKKNIVVMKNGVEDFRAKYAKIKEDENSVIYIGRLVDYKGINELVDAFDIVLAEVPEAKLHIYGTGEKIEEYRAKAKHNKNILIHGYANDALEKIAESAIFVLPSYYEGLSMSLLDAAMMEKKIIATNVDGNPEVIHDEAGLLVPAKNSKELASAIITLLRDKQLGNKLAKNARKNYEKEYDFEKTVKEILIPIIEK